MQDILLGIDIGTSACKVAAFSCDGETLAVENCGYPVYRPQRGWAEQSPDEWWKAVCMALRALAEKGVDLKKVRGIGVDGQSWSAVAMDREGVVLCNTPIWMDSRADGICDYLAETYGRERFEKTNGNPLRPEYTLPKVLWYKAHRRGLYDATYKVLQSNSFIVQRLTGEYTQDLSQGYGWACYDVKGCRWDVELCKEVGINSDILPQLYPCHGIVGYVTANAARQTGLGEGTPVVAGGLDAACGALGAGVLHDREAQEQGGQAGGMSICMTNYRPVKDLILSGHVVPDRWLLQGGTVGGGGVLRWFESEFGMEERVLAAQKGTNAYMELDMRAQDIQPGSDGLIFLPYMAGERSPIWDPRAKGVYYGIDFMKTKAHFIRSSMEGVAYSLQHNLLTAADGGVVCDVLHSVGGAANSRVWTQIKADVTGKKIVVLGSDTATCLGAALLAGVGIGIYANIEESVEKTVRTKTVYTPNMQHHETYQRMYEKYLDIYSGLRDVMHKEENR